MDGRGSGTGHIRDRWIGLMLGVVLLFLAHGMALLFRVQPAVSLWFPPSGVAIALALWLGPVGVVLTMIVSVIMAPAWGSDGWMRLIGLMDGIEPLVAWFLYCRCFRGSLMLKGLETAIAFIISAPLAACASSALTGCLTLYALGNIPFSSLGHTIVQWWLGNAIGTMTIAPALLLTITPILQQWPRSSLQTIQAPVLAEMYATLRQRGLEIGLILMIAACTALLTVRATQVSNYTALQVSLLGSLPSLWAASRFGVRGAVLTASFSVLMNLLAYLLIYPNAIFLPFFPVDAQLLFTHKLNLLLQAIVALLVGAAMTDRETTQVALAVEQVRSTEYQARAHLSSQLMFLNRLLKESNQHLQESESRFRTSVENMLDCFGMYSAIRDDKGQIIDFCTEYVNEAACINNQLNRDQQIGRGLCEILPGHRGSGLFEEYRQVVETGQPLVKDSLIYEDDYGERHLIKAFDIRGAKWGDGFVVTWRDVTDRRRAEEALQRTEAALREANERFELAATAVDCLIYDWRTDSSFVERTAGLTRLLGYSLKEAEPTAEWWGQLIHPDDLAHLPKTLEETNFIQGRCSLEYRVRHKQGHYIYIQDQSLALFDHQGKVVRLIGSTTDISDRKRAEFALQASEKRYRDLADAMPQMVWTADANGVINYFNHRWYDYTGLSEAESMGIDGMRAIHPADRTLTLENWSQAITTGNPFEIEHRIRRWDGGYRWFIARSLGIRNVVGEITSWVGTITDIDDRKQIEEELRQKQERLDLAQSVAKMGSFEWNIQTNLNIWSPELEALYGLQPGEFSGTYEAWTEFVHPDDLSQATEAIRNALKTGEAFDAEWRVRWPDGSIHWLQARAKVFHDSNGQPLRMVGVNFDTSDVKQAELERQRSETILNAFLTSSPIGLALFDKELRYLYANESLATLNDLTLQDHLGRTLQEVLPQVAPEFVPMLQQILETREPVLNFESSGETLSGQYRYCLSSHFPVCLPDGELLGIGNTVMDITELKQAEMALQRTEARLHRLVEANVIGIVEATLDRITATNDAFLHLVGYSRKELITGQVRWQDFTPPEYLSLDQQALEELRTYGRCTPFEKEYIHKNGSRVPILIGAALVEEEPFTWLGFILDQTEQKRIQTERAELLEREQAARQQAESASRMKDEFLAIVSHELRSPLNGILGWSRLLRTRQLSPEKTEQALASIERNAQAQTQLIEDLLDISRIIRGTIRLNLRPTNLVPIIQAALDTIRPTAATKSIHLEAHLNPDIGFVSGDLDRLQQVVWNLLSNAVKFTPEGGRVEVSLSLVTRHSSTYARITVTDTGKGIQPDFLPYVFERFRQADSTTTRHQGGLGLGLAIVRNLVELHGGNVHVASAGEGQGATFNVEFPLLVVEALPLVSSSGSSSLLSPEPNGLQGVRVLVVDDEADTREFLVTALEQFGAVVTAAASTQEALQCFRANRPDVLLSDIGMPQADGYTLIREIRALPPEAGGQVPAAAITAYVRGDDRLQALNAGFQLHVPKPIEPIQLLNAVVQLVGRSPWNEL